MPSSVGERKFQALPLGGVMAGGEVDAAGGFAGADGMADDGRGGVAIAEQGSEAIGGEHFGGGEGEVAAKESGVVTDYYG